MKKDKTNRDQAKKDDRAAGDQRAEHTGQQGTDPREDQLGENAGGNFGLEDSVRDEQKDPNRSEKTRNRSGQTMESGQHEESEHEHTEDDESDNR